MPRQQPDIEVAEKRESMKGKVVPFLGAGDNNKFFDVCQFIEGDATMPETMKQIEDQAKVSLGSESFTLIFYLAVSWEKMLKVVAAIPERPLGATRIVMEKPLCSDLVSAKKLSDSLANKFGEDNLYRLDHFLGQAMVANIHILRFVNTILEPLWCKDYVSAIVIASREISLPDKDALTASNFEKHGIIRDVIMDHLLNLVELICMEPPSALTSKEMKKKRLDLLKKIKVLNKADSKLVLGKCESYNGQQPTFATMVLSIETDRWKGVPIIIKAGKGLNEKRTDIRLQLKQPLFSQFVTSRQTDPDDKLLESSSLRDSAPRNEICIRIKPNEDIYVKVVTAASGSKLLETKLDLMGNSKKESSSLKFKRSAYERLLDDVISGIRDDFLDAERLEQRWLLFSDLVAEVDSEKEFIEYTMGSRGPEESDLVMNSVGFLRQPKIEAELIGVKRFSKLRSLQSKFDLSTDSMQDIIFNVYSEIKNGLLGKDSSLKMLPSFVTQLPDGMENGTFYALDIGGTNFRVTRFVFNGKGNAELTDERKFTIPDSVMVAEKPEALYDFLAECMMTVQGEGEARKYGYTFSYPCQQLSINQGILINWTKGFKTKGVEGEEVVAPLQESLKRHGFDGEIVALVNDTVGTLASA